MSDVDRFFTALAYVYFLRVPLLTWGALIALPFVALPPRARLGALLRGLFDIVDPVTSNPDVAFALVTVAALMAAAAIAVTARLILWDGGERFEIDAAPRTPGVELAIRLVPGLLVIAVLGGVWVQSAPEVGFLRAAIGTIAGLALFALTAKIHQWLYAAAAPVLRRFIAMMVRWSPQGFMQDGRARELHVFASLQFFVSLLLYIAIFVAKGFWGSFGESPQVPTLCLVLVLAMLVCWTLSAISFTFDRYRVPVLLVLSAYGTIASFAPQGDHFFLSMNRASATAPAIMSAAEVLEARAGKPAIVVAATGGGIQAAAWTARVLAGLHHDATACGDDFDQALLAISSVSGGSAGAMYIVDEYQEGRLPSVSAVDEDPAVKSAEASSLDEVAWGLAYPDLVWTVAPFLKGVWLKPPHLVNGPNLVEDRGSALEDAWKRSPSLGSATLDDWRRDVMAQPRQRPAIIFNATIAETGEQLLLGTTRLDASAGSIGRQEFWRLYPDSDVLVTTAARLSATFPYVSPASRILRRGVFRDEFHIVDGGYYDNYGTATLIEWLDQGLRQTSRPKPSAVLILQIRSSPVAAAAQPEGARGWWFDLTQPLRTLAAVRDAGQLSHSDVDIDLVRGSRAYGVDVTSIVIQFPAHVDSVDEEPPPLSWHLTPADRGRIALAWKTLTAERQAVHDFLRPSHATPCVRDQAAFAQTQKHYHGAH